MVEPEDEPQILKDLRAAYRAIEGTPWRPLPTGLYATLCRLHSSVPDGIVLIVAGRDAGAALARLPLPSWSVLFVDDDAPADRSYGWALRA